MKGNNKEIFLYYATVSRISENGKTVTKFTDMFPALEGLKKGAVTDKLVNGYFKSTRSDAPNSVYRIESFEIIKSLGKSFFY